MNNRYTKAASMTTVMIRVMRCSKPIVAAFIMALTQPGQTLPLMMKIRKFAWGHLLMPAGYDLRLPDFGFSRMDSTHLCPFWLTRFVRIACDSS